MNECLLNNWWTCRSAPNPEKNNNELQASANKFQRPPNCCPNLASLSLVSQAVAFYSSTWREGRSLLQLQRPVYFFHAFRVLLLLINGYAIRNYLLVALAHSGILSDSSLNTNLALCSFNSWAEI